MICPSCGKDVASGGSYCPLCGADLRAASTSARKDVMLLTSNYAPGYRVDRVLGMVYGITVRSRGVGGNIIAGLRTLTGGEIHEYTQMAQQARQQALDRLVEQARSVGANAVMSVMFDSTEIGGTMDEIIAFGTAVMISPAPNDQQLVKLT